jgi:hypothetical protein
MIKSESDPEKRAGMDSSQPKEDSVSNLESDPITISEPPQEIDRRFKSEP